MEMLPEGLTIEDLLPHRDGMLLIGEVVSLTREQTVTRSVASSRWPLIDGAGVQPLILVELAAQTAGINNGWQNRLENGADAAQGGWIVGVKNARFSIDQLPLDAEILVTSENRFAYDNFREVHAVATVDGLVAAEITLQLMQADAI
jgi:predicted hotdog family 3-hydroxylacyl-ACP dehydratase